MSARRLRKAAQTAWNDQHRAARRDALAAMETMAARKQTMAVSIPVGLALWLNLAATEADQAGRLLCCAHAATQGPQPLAGLWTSPGYGRVACPPCMHAFARAEMHGKASDHSCDRCGREVAKAEPWGVRGAVSAGRTIWCLGLCQRCAGDLGVTA